jgi:hypothetical protein
VAALLLVVAAVAAAIGYGLPGIRILFGPPPSIPVSPSVPASAAPGAGLGLGTALSLDEARDLVDFEIALPGGAAIGPPDAVFLSGGRLALAWGQIPRFPGTAGRAGAAHHRARATSTGRSAFSGGARRAITVDSAPAAGSRVSALLLLAPDGTRMRHRGRWLSSGRDGVTIGSGELTRDAAIALAETMR